METLDIILESYEDIVIIETGFPTQDAMRQLIDWYNADRQAHHLVKCALFAYDLVSIHAFQDGNGR